MACPHRIVFSCRHFSRCRVPLPASCYLRMVASVESSHHIRPGWFRLSSLHGLAAQPYGRARPSGDKAASGPLTFTLEGSILNSHQKAMIAGGNIHAVTALVDSASLRAQSSHPSRQPSSSLPTPAHRATSFGSVIIILGHFVLAFEPVFAVLVVACIVVVNVAAAVAGLSAAWACMHLSTPAF